MVNLLPELTTPTAVLIPAQRHELILKHLSLYKISSCATLADYLQVSESTIRRDLEILEKQGLVERTRGGAILNEHIRAEAEYVQRAQRFIEEKRSIGKIAATLIEAGDMVFINSGTTTSQLIQNIHGIPKVTLVTNNTSALTDGQDTDFELNLLGGKYLPVSQAVFGYFALDNLNQIYATKTFIGVEGLSIKYGCTVSTFAEAEIIRTMIAHTQGPVIIVADHTKWGAVSNHLVARIDQINKLVTDEGFDPNARISLLSRAVDVIIANQS